MPLTKKFENLMIPLEAIKSATNNFSDDNCIGRGGFGKVYKGELVHSKGQTIVALKRLDPVFGQGNPEFWKEIVMLSLYKHENIISLLGFCDECNEKILVYEYASRRSLDFYLNNNELTWIRRLKICIGAARGLAYLHNPGASQQRVLHRDVKSSNILIDESWSAKISDLGLSKFGPANQKYTFLVSKTVGTIGYCDPLYVETGLLTKESDVYSFGVVLFEVLCGRLCISNKNGTLQSLTTLVRKYYVDNKINEIIYANMKEEINPRSLEAFTTIAYRCLNREFEKRPLMTDIVVSLETALAYQEEINPRSLEAFTTTAYRCMNRELKESPLMTDIVDGPGPRSDVTPSEGKDGAGSRSIVTPSLGKFDPIMEERKRKRIVSQLGSERRTKLRKQYHLDILEAENLILRAKLSELDKLILPKGDNHSMD